MVVKHIASGWALSRPAAGHADSSRRRRSPAGSFGPGRQALRHFAGAALTASTTAPAPCTWAAACRPARWASSTTTGRAVRVELRLVGSAARGGGVPIAHDDADLGQKCVEEGRANRAVSVFHPRPSRLGKPPCGATWPSVRRRPGSAETLASPEAEPRRQSDVDFRHHPSGRRARPRGTEAAAVSYRRLMAPTQ
jgi:hypothetical protein